MTSVYSNYMDSINSTLLYPGLAHNEVMTSCAQHYAYALGYALLSVLAALKMTSALVLYTGKSNVFHVQLISSSEHG